MKVVLTGDVFLGGDAEKHKPEIQISEYYSADIRILNLEHPISENNIEVNKSVLFTDTRALNTLKKIKADAVSLANNHIQDKGLSGIKETIEHLKKHNIKHIGAGFTITEAAEPLWITQNICILSYCQYNSPTLTQIQLATAKDPGVNPLSLQNVLKDLDKIPDNSKAILYLHWGREHVYLTQYKNIELAKTLLEHPKVALIVGMHPHRIQGYLQNKKKKAYFSLGNFLFPNFYIKPPISVYAPLDYELKGKIPITRQYHSVEQLTRKKWKWVNRISLIIEFDTENLESKHIPVYQDDNLPRVTKVKGIKKHLILGFIEILNLFYSLNNQIYTGIEKPYSKLYFKLWHIQIMVHKLRNYGIKWAYKKFKLKTKSNQ